MKSLIRNRERSKKFKKIVKVDEGANLIADEWEFHKFMWWDINIKLLDKVNLWAVEDTRRKLILKMIPAVNADEVVNDLSLDSEV